MRIVRPCGPEYEKGCVVSNARFHYYPWAIYYCESPDDVVTAVRDAHTYKKTVRVRAGGHQHEGMCIADGVLLIDLSGINSIDFHEPDRSAVRIGAGARRGELSCSLWKAGFMFAGGGCSDVHVGGLTHGGGWGPVSRKFGLTCDSLSAVYLVTAEGGAGWIRDDTGSPIERAVLRALRGGGGGNFGIVTTFEFKTHQWGQPFTDFSLGWTKDQLRDNALPLFIDNWAQRFPNDGDQNLTSFLRVSVDDPKGNQVLLGGRYLGTSVQTEQVLRRLLQGQPWAEKERIEYDEYLPGNCTAVVNPEQPVSQPKSLGSLRGYQPGAVLTTEGAPANGDLSNTCAGVSFRHKISSAFARTTFGAPAAAELSRLIRTAPVVPGARQYVSLHCLGGAVRTGRPDTAFAFRDRNLLLQYQAWWQTDASDLDCRCITWIRDMRQAMSEHTDGAFINFVDREIPLEEYYKDQFPFLREMKGRLDPKEFFKFDMSIPPTF
jgi:hypothetical protein